MQSDFRGLLNADYVEALNNCNQLEQQNEVLSSQTYSKRKTSVNIKELFPMPTQNFTHKNMSMNPQNEDTDVDEEVVSLNRNLLASKAFSSLNATLTKISRPMTAYYSTKQGGPISAMSSLPISRLQSAFQRP